MSSAFSNCMVKDQAELTLLFQRIAQRQKRGQPCDKLLQQLETKALSSQTTYQKRKHALPTLDYPPQLPVTGQREKLVQLIRQHQVVVLAGETGSGKTTQLPKICLEAGRGVGGMIGHTQPRRLAARTVGQRIADELNVPLGQQVGFQVRFTEQVSDISHIKLMTDGILLAETRQDPDLLRYDTIIVDEAHERSLNIDFLLGYLKQLLARRDDLKLIITSATIDLERFSTHFSNAPVVEVSGRTFPVDLWYRPLFASKSDQDQDVQTGIQHALEEIDQHERQSKQHNGDVLIFLPGERDIRDIALFLRKQEQKHWHILPLYGRLSFSEQQKVFQPSGKTVGRRIVLATNVAETSVTVPGIRYVIDPGTARMSRYSYRSKVQRLPIEAISQASANQRKGRCGRLSAGICIRLYDEADFISRPEFTEAEILRTNLASVILQMHDLKLGPVEEFPFIDAPDSRFVNDGVKLLQELGGLDQSRRLTTLGKQLARLPVDPRIGRMVVAANDWHALNEVLLIASALTIQDPRERPQDKQQAADQQHLLWREKDSDFLSLVNLWQEYEHQRQQLTQNQLRNWCSKHFVSYLRMREWREVHRQLLLMCQQMGFKTNTELASYEAVHRALLTGLLGHIGCKDEDGQFAGPRQRKFLLFPGSALAKKPPPWIMAAELVETSRLFARCVAKIEPQWVEQSAGGLLKYNYSEPAWHKRQGQVMAFEQVSLYGLVLASKRRVGYGKIDPEVCQQLLVMEGLVQNNLLTKGKFLAHNQALVEGVEALEAKSRRRDILVDDQVLFDFYNGKMESVKAPIVSAASFESWRKHQEKSQPEYLFLGQEDLMQHGAEGINNNSFPDRLVWNAMSWPLSYHFEPNHEQDGVTIEVPASQLKRLPLKRLQWLVPGLLKDKLAALLKGLPKAQRKAFVPVPQYAQALFEALSPDDVDLPEAIAKHLQRMSGRPFDVQLLQQVDVETHLLMNVQVMDEAGQPIAQGRDPLRLLGDYATGTTISQKSSVVHSVLKQGLTQWDFMALPETMTIEQGAMKLPVWPAIKDQGKSVDIVFTDSAQEAEATTHDGLVRLYRLAVNEQTKHLTRSLAAFGQAELLYGALGTAQELREQIFDQAAELVFLPSSLAVAARPSNEAEFKASLEQRGHYPEAVEQVLTLSIALLKRNHAIKKSLKGQLNLAWANVYQDVGGQLDRIMNKQFIAQTQWQYLEQMPRYLKAIEARLERFKSQLPKENAAVQELRGWQQKIDTAKTQCLSYTPAHKALNDFAWSMEEYRVSLFAQQLGTQKPISAKRLQKQWDMMNT
ncbi:ATP-dependent RNA helicase HrpA [Candidatus Njordibacter sp. Uisw_039]|uniref:ATP-dependent RNA helicase HrpA n=1 Tax=Candidatus Njordibacter sp. Uisw_039 TaxID=3230972 RepID=UPI003D44DAA0